MKILYFAWVRQRIGISEEEVTAPASAGTVWGLVEFLRRRGPGYEAAFRDMNLLRVAVNQQHTGLDAAIGANDEIAFFPPVTGG